MRDIEKVIEETSAGLLPFESWEHLPGESSAAYAAFCSFRDYGPERNIRRAAEASLTDGSATQVSKRYRLWRDWSMKYTWRKRAADYDAYLDKLKQTERRKTIEEREEAHREITGKMLHVVSKKLDTMDPKDLSQGAVVEWMKSAIDVERDMLGVSPGKDDAGGKSVEIHFSPDFKGL